MRIITDAMKAKSHKKQSKPLRIPSEATSQAAVTKLRQFIDAVVLFGESNTTSSVLPYNTSRQKLRQTLIGKFPTITEAKLTFPNGDECTLEFGVQTVKNLFGFRKVSRRKAGC